MRSMVLETIAAANAAYAIIKQCVQNGSELASAGKAIADFTTAKQDLEREAAKHGSNIDGSKSDLEVFLGLEDIKRKEDELRSAMQLYGRAGMYNDYVKFCSEARVARQKAAKEAQRLKTERIDNIIFWLYIAAVIGLGTFALGLVVWVLKEANSGV
jgi:hypothetical protein